MVSFHIYLVFFAGLFSHSKPVFKFRNVTKNKSHIIQLLPDDYLLSGSLSGGYGAGSQTKKMGLSGLYPPLRKLVFQKKARQRNQL